MTEPKEILEAALRLSPERREALIEALAASLDPSDLGEYLEEEIQRRVADLDSGQVKTVTAEEVFARLHRRFRGK